MERSWKQCCIGMRWRNGGQWQVAVAAAAKAAFGAVPTSSTGCRAARGAEHQGQRSTVEQLNGGAAKCPATERGS